MTVASATTTIEVQGMTCEGCVRSVEKGLSRLAGVERVEVSLAKALAVVLHDPDVVDEAALREKVRAIGFVS